MSSLWAAAVAGQKAMVVAVAVVQVVFLTRKFIYRLGLQL
jgi:hypothetical protein